MERIAQALSTGNDIFTGDQAGQDGDVGKLLTANKAGHCTNSEDKIKALMTQRQAFKVVKAMEACLCKGASLVKSHKIDVCHALQDVTPPQQEPPLGPHGGGH